MGVLLLLVLLAYGLTTQSPETTIDDVLASGRPAPPAPFALSVLEPGDLGPVLERELGSQLDDRRLTLGELRGTPAVVNYWASWCVPCREEAPRLESAWRQARRGGVLFLGLNMQDITGDARGFLREFGVSYPTIRDPTDATARSWGATGIPETYFLSSRGEVVGHVIGVVSEDQLRTGVAAARSGRVVGAEGGGATTSAAALR
jgi:cytochrome c biogenesis protein CcmG/thiol:disulfide interchange protein DsbE